MSDRGDARLIDRNGACWRVREVDSRDTPGARATASLLCESDAIVRRLWRFPPEWRALGDSALLAVFDIA